jgi:uncharacterized membrane protein YkoI
MFISYQSQCYHITGKGKIKMKNKSVIGLIAVLIVLVSISGCITNDQTNNTNTDNQTVQQDTTGNTTSNSTGANVSAADAKKIAKKYIQQPGATAGEPTLINTDGKSTYMVPVMLNGNQIGEVIVDAQTGEFVDGAGGVANSTG